MLTVILTGGQSRRMGRDKALLPAGGEGGANMRDRLISRYAKALGSVAVSVDRAGRYTGTEAIELADTYPGMGPLNGIYSAFSKTDADIVFLTATDLPNGDPSLALYLAESLDSREACIIRRGTGDLEPLFAVYTRSCLSKAAKLLNEDKRAMIHLINAADTLYIDESALSGRWDLDKVLWNINTPEEYERFLEDSLIIN